MPPWWYWLLIAVASPPVTAAQYLAMTYFAVVVMGRGVNTPEE